MAERSRHSLFALIPLALIFSWNLAFWLALPLHLGAFFISAMACHGELARAGPPARQLTEFYLRFAAAACSAAPAPRCSCRCCSPACGNTRGRPPPPACCGRT